MHAGIEPGQGRSPSRPPDGPRLPPQATLSGFAVQDLKKKVDAPGSAALVEAFFRRAKEQHRPREDETLPLGKGRKLHSIRTTLDGNEYRLIYGRVRAKKGSTPAASAASEHPIRFVALLAWAKKRRRLVADDGATAWRRLELWLEEHPDYQPS